MQLTVPQLILLNHAAWVNRERGQRKFDNKRQREKEGSDSQPDVAPAPTQDSLAQALPKMTSAQWKNYYRDFL